MVVEVARQAMAENGKKMDSRVFCVAVMEVAKVDFGDLISYERQKIQVSKVTPQTPTLGVSRVFESLGMGSEGRLWPKKVSIGFRVFLVIPLLLFLLLKIVHR